MNPRATRRFVAYYRVSTDRQGQSGLGLDAQRKAIAGLTNLLEQAINTDDGARAARIIQDALGIESDDVANYVFPKT